ncbi:hypothetical protein [Mucilaginibacter paludis]|uniref:hypothetical protein n=1 Tax=Mucilaginibacter paludis TaxID=423351 RepID=UPI001C272994|nr:hypothetical protein [Mucilaginibacter paludis]
MFILNACHKAASNPGTTVRHGSLVAKVNKTVIADNNIIIKPCAIIVKPNSRLISKVKKEMNDDEAFYIATDDYMFYMAQAELYLDSVKANKIRRLSEGSVKFNTISGRTFVMKLDTLFFGVLLFNGKDKPITADITDLQADYQKYMKN